MIAAITIVETMCIYCLVTSLPIGYHHLLFLATFHLLCPNAGVAAIIGEVWAYRYSAVADAGMGGRGEGTWEKIGVPPIWGPETPNVIKKLI